MPMFCIECENQNQNKKFLCKFCGKKTDKYLYTSNTYKFIDCILLKDQVYRHFILNHKINIESLFYTAILYFLPNILIFFSNIKISKLELDDLLIDFHFDNIIFQVFNQILYLFILIVIFKNISKDLLIYSICFSSFFSFFKIFFIIWECQDVQFYVILDILNCCSNVCALKCFQKNPMYICMVVLGSKIFSYIILGYFFGLIFNISNV